MNKECDATSWNRKETILATVLGAVTILSRWPFQINILANHDAVNYALALEHFDMRLHQPQPPGYPLYILLGRAFNLFFQNSPLALLWLSTIFSGLAVIAIYLAGREIFNRRVGTIAALLLATSSLFWFQGEIAAPYTADFFASAVVGWLCYRLAASPERGGIWIAALAVGLAGAFRLQTIIFLFPLFLYALRKHSWKAIVGGIVMAGSIFGAFFLPAIMVSGGPAAFVESMRITVPIFYSTETLVRSTQWIRFVRNAQTTARYTFCALGELALPFVLIGYLTRSNCLRPWRNSKLFFLGLWLLPTYIFYLLIYPGNPGTILVCMPPLFLLTAAGLGWVLTQPRWVKTAAWAALGIMLIWRIALFTILPQYPFGDSYRRFDNYESVISVAGYYHTKLALLEQVPVEGTIVYANAFRHLQYYMPQYRVFSVPALFRSDPSLVKSVVSIQDGMIENWSRVDVTALVPSKTKRIVIFDLPPEILLADPALVEEKSQNGHSIKIISIPAHATALWTSEGLSVHAVE